MPFARPTLAELVTRTRADIRGRLDNDGALLRRAMTDILAAVWSGAVHVLHGHIDWVHRQIFADLSDDDELLRQAGLYGISPTAALFAAGPVGATGVDTSTIPNGAILVHSLGETYAVTNGPIDIAGGVAALQVLAVTAGAAANLDEGEKLTFETPPAGVDAEATVTAPGIEGGVNEGTIEQTRTRLIERLREPPAGGRDADYVAWAKLVSGVTRVFVFPIENGLGTIVVRFVEDDEAGEVFFPDAGQVALVQASIDGLRPTTAEAFVVAPVDQPVAFTISITPDTAATRAAVTSELQDLMFRGQPGDGAGAGTVLRSQMQTSIGIAAGVDDYLLTIPAADVVPVLGNLPTLGVITWV